MGKQKQKMTLAEVKAILSECDNDSSLLDNMSEFKRHALGKAARAGRLELEAVGFLYRELKDIRIGNYLLKHLDYTIKDLASVDILGYAYMNSTEFEELFEGSRGIGFESGLEFVEFVKGKYNVDLSIKPTGMYKIETDADREFIFFSSGFTGSGNLSALLEGSDEKAEANKAFYRDAFLYIVRLLQYNRVSRRSGGRDLKYTLPEVFIDDVDRIGAINYPVLKELVKNEIEDRDAKIEVLMAVVNAGYFSFDSLRNPFDSFDVFLEVIKDIKELSTPAKFPYATKNSEVRRIFIYNLFRLGINMNNKAWSKARKVRLTPEQKLLLFTELYKPFLRDKDLLKSLTEDYDAHSFFESLLNTAPIEQRDEIYSHVVQMGYELGSSIVRLCRMRKIEFFPTELMTQDLVKAGFDWSSMAVPKERLYDLEYIDNIVSSIGAKGIIFGKSSSNRNEFFVNNIDPSKLPKEFYDKYDSAIDWDLLCYCTNLPISFVKENKEKMGFCTFSKKAALSVDDELAEWLLSYDGCRSEGEARNRRYVARSAGSLSAKFIAKHLGVLRVRDVGLEGRSMSVFTPNITLNALLEELS